MRNLPQSIKVCLWSYDTNKMSLSNPNDRFTLIFNVLNYGSETAIHWLQEHFSEKEFKKVIKKSYASAWVFKGRLKRWSQFYKVSPKWKTRIEYIWSKEKKSHRPV